MSVMFEVKQSNEVYAAAVGSIDFPLHIHPQMELFLVFSGETIITVRDQTRILTAGDMAVIFPNEIHGYASLDINASAALVHWDLSYTGRNMDLLLRNHPVNSFLKTDLIHPTVAYLITEMIEEQKNGKDSPVYAPLIQLLLARLLPSLKLQRNKGTDYPELTYRISNYISEHFRETLTLGQLAQQMGISKSHLSHLFTEKMGQNFSSYLSSIRLSYACQLLSETDISVTEISEISGFESQRTFFRAFHNRFRITPLKYRQASKRDA